MRQGKRKLATLAVACAMITAGVGVNPATAKSSKVETDLTVVAKADSVAGARRAARKVKGRVDGEVLPGRGLYRIVVTDEVKTKDVAKKTEELAKKVGNEKTVAWAAPDGSEVDDDRFYAWRFYAWPNGHLERHPGIAPGAQTLHDFLGLDQTHRLVTGKGVTVAILDTGFDVDHPMLEEHLLPGIDLVDGDTNVGDHMNRRDDDGDGRIDEAHGHGTFVSGIVAQVAPDAKILPIRVLDADGVGEVYAVIEGIDAAIAAGVDVINLSFGMPYNSKPLEEAIKRARKADVVVVGAAGNEGSKDKQYPAGIKDVIAVAAYDPAIGSVARFGSRGGWVDVSAPGVDIISSRPGGQVGSWSGSSLAAPIVAAQVALLLELDPRKAVKDADKIIRDSARKASKGVKDDVGVIDMREAIDRLRR